MRHHVVVGAHGEVGSALVRVLRQVNPRGEVIWPLDIGTPPAAPASLPASLPVYLHVCIGWSPEFVEIVQAYVETYDPDLVIVHSTVAPGTCDAHGWVHSPVRGRHPDLTAGLLRFAKHCGGARAAEAAAVFADRSITTHVHSRAIDTEALKLWELAQYGIAIRVMQEVHAWCAAHGADFETVYRDGALTYNAGYRAFGEDRFVRPVLDHVPGPIGGHCVTQNAPLLGSDFVRALLEPLSPPEVNWDQPVPPPADMEPLW